MGSAHTSPPTSASASTARTICWRLPTPSVLDAQLFTGHRAVAQLARRGFEDDHALLHDVAAVAHAQRDARVLLDEQHGHAQPLELADHVADVADGPRGEAPPGVVPHAPPAAGPH